MAATATNKINTMILRFFLMTTTFTILLSCCSATVYKVGDADGWTAKDDVYYSWAEGKEFHVGDSLVFEYDRSSNDVTQVSGALEYQFCDSSSPKAVYITGHDTVTLTEPGFYYFISSNHVQCESGQRLDILVVHDPSRPIPPPPPSKTLPFGKTYKVGGDDLKGWSVPEESDFYYKWSEEKQFLVGDKLLFEYSEEANDDVLEISGDLEFKYCDPTSPVSVHKTGHDLVTLTKPGVHYFISSKTGHCEAGLKLRVVVGSRPNVPKLSPLDRLARWLRAFRPHHHH
ncbi:unnamed protein product [Microthlaspi erraticum]|uniref:Phytocyanin domain-containing protein n=1 Tax=Microthlaspi erraticum TaxID=1685480 RepID=A0A6D2K6V9_9BRAS|nr:unnamed protein product [Microthlaspi erraticum]